jgi:hypothetical protein
MWAMTYPYIPIDVDHLMRQTLRGYGPEDPEPLPERKPRRTLVLRRQPTRRPRWTPLSPASRRSRA